MTNSVSLLNKLIFSFSNRRAQILFQKKCLFVLLNCRFLFSDHNQVEINDKGSLLNTNKPNGKLGMKILYDAIDFLKLFYFHFLKKIQISIQMTMILCQTK